MRTAIELPTSREEWRLFVRSYLKALMMLRGYNYAALAKELSSQFDMQMGEAQLRHLINRGSFKAELLLQCAVAMNVEFLDVPLFKSSDSPESEDSKMHRR